MKTHSTNPNLSEPRWLRVLLTATALGFLLLMLVVPLVAVFYEALKGGWDLYLQSLTDPEAWSAIKLTLITALIVVPVNAILGVAMAWLLTRFDFRGKQLLTTLLDLPFALPTAVTGIALATLYAPNGWIGRFFEPLGIKIAFTPIGIWIALIVVSLPFIVRAVQPVLEELSGEYEEAAATLGASRWTTFRRVLLPEITPALLTGAGMMFARSTGEYGSVIFIAGNIPMVSEILPLIITGKLEQYDAQGASAVALFMLMISFVILLILNIMQWTLSRRAGAKV